MLLNSNCTETTFKHLPCLMFGGARRTLQCSIFFLSRTESVPCISAVCRPFAASSSSVRLTDSSRCPREEEHNSCFHPDPDHHSLLRLPLHETNRQWLPSECTHRHVCHIPANVIETFGRIFCPERWKETSLAHKEEIEVQHH